MTKFVFVVCAFAAVLMVSVGCNSSDGNSFVEPPADVSGEWRAVAHNAGSAVFNGCTGDLTHLEGRTVAGTNFGAACVNSGPMITTQTGASFTHPPVTYSCDSGDYGSLAGGGTVAGRSVTGQVDTISEYYNFIGSELYTGTVVTANTIAVSEYRISASGDVNGSCNISPTLSITVTIFEPAFDGTLEPRQASEAFSLMRMLVLFPSEVDSVIA
jgi:hypothetical protein